MKSRIYTTSEIKFSLYSYLHHHVLCIIQWILLDGQILFSLVLRLASFIWSLSQPFPFDPYTGFFFGPLNGHILSLKIDPPYFDWLTIITQFARLLVASFTTTLSLYMIHIKAISNQASWYCLSFSLSFLSVASFILDLDLMWI